MNRPFNPQIRSRDRAAGFSLIEVMVASTIGLIVVLAVTSSVLTMGRQFSVVASNVAAQGSAQIALTLLDAAGRSAGAGFYSNGKLLCPTWNAYNGTAMVSDGAAFMPARIGGGASNTVSDTLVFSAASGAGALSAARVLVTIIGSSIKVSESATLAVNDLALVGVADSGRPCTLFQVRTVGTSSACGVTPGTCTHLVTTPNEGVNPAPGAFTDQPTYGYENDTAAGVIGPAVVSRIGTAAGGFRQDAFAIQCNSLVRFNAFMTPTPPACTASPLSFGTGVDAIATDIVLIQAQYGISATGDSDVVTAWVEPSGATWGAPSAANAARIKAVRVAVVARSREAEGTPVSSECTNANAVVNTGPCSFQDAAAPVIDLSATTVAAGKTWRHYRYRVHQSVIPLRNVIWADS